jgi:RES domain-containing protein
MRVFRIGAAVFTRTRKEAFSGQGGVYASARWHSAGRPIVYTAQSLSLAALEILVRLKQTNDIQPFYAYSMEIPDHLILTPKSLPVCWKSRIAVSRAFGDACLKTNNSPALRVPTVITPGEWNVLVNPLLPRFSLKWVVTVPTPTRSTRECCRSGMGFGLGKRRGINDTTRFREGLSPNKFPWTTA